MVPRSKAAFQALVDLALSALVAWEAGTLISFPLKEVGEVFSEGVARLAQVDFVALRNVAKRVSADQRLAGDPVARHLLAVAAHAGSLSYSDYISESLLDAPFAPEYVFDPAGLRLARLIAFLESFITEQDRRPKRELGPVNGALSLVNGLPLDRPRLQTGWLRWTLMPRSDHDDEKWFMRIVQGTHLGFATMCELELQAMAFAQQGSWVLSAERLKFAKEVTDACIKLVRALFILNATWPQFRDNTLPASADQDLPIRLSELMYERPCQNRKSLANVHLGSNIPAQTLDDFRSAAPPAFRLELDRLGRSMISWYRAHAGSVAKLNASLPVSVAALYAREPHYLRGTKRRLAIPQLRAGLCNCP
jgi:hypothetical protein